MRHRIGDPCDDHGPVRLHPDRSRVTSMVVKQPEARRGSVARRGTLGAGLTSPPQNCCARTSCDDSVAPTAGGGYSPAKPDRWQGSSVNPVTDRLLLQLEGGCDLGDLMNVSCVK